MRERMVQGSRSWQPEPLHGIISIRVINEPSRSFTCEGVASHVPQRHAQHQGHRHPRPGRGAGYLDTCYVVDTCYVWPRVTSWYLVLQNVGGVCLDAAGHPQVVHTHEPRPGEREIHQEDRK